VINYSAKIIYCGKHIASEILSLLEHFEHSEYYEKNLSIEKI